MNTAPSTLSEWLKLLETRHPLTIDLGLERTRFVWERLGRPRPARRLVTIAGTNGKGSTTAYIASMLQALGYRCGTYTSPHFHRYNERVAIRNVPVSDQQLVDAFAEVDRARDSVSLTYFEFGTLAAFLLLARAQLDFAVLEVGLGGRLDAVNILDTDCAVVTTIGLDHQEYLGPDRESIGREKAGIIRGGKPVICGETDPPESLLRATTDAGALLYRIGLDYGVRPGNSVWWMGTREFTLPAPPMPGPHQVNNMATALAAVSTLLPDALDTPDLLRQGLSAVCVPGRLQHWDAGASVWVDVGHNPHAAVAVAETFRSLNLRVRCCVLGMLRDKDAAAVAAALEGLVQEWHCAGLGGERGRSGADLAAEISRVVDGDRVRAFEDVAAALSAALAAAGPDDSILVFGSFLTAGQAAVFLTGYC